MNEKAAAAAREAEEAGARPHAVWLWPWVIAGLAFAIRALPYRDVFVGGRVLFIESDSYYHLRRIVYAIERFPETLARDPYLGFPEVSRAIWPPILDNSIAWLLRPIVGAGAGSEVERIVAWIPPLFGAATVWCVYRIAERHFDRRVAIVAAMTLSILSGHFWYSQLGFLDHHVVVSWLSCLLLGCTMDQVGCRAAADPRALIRSGVWIGFLCGLMLLVWPGGILFVALVQAALFAQLLTRPGLEEARDRLRGLIAIDLVALVVVLPFTAFSSWPQWSDYSPVVLSRFQPWLFGLLSGHAIVCDQLWRRTGSAGDARHRVAQALGLGILGVGASLILIPELRGAATDSLQWLGRTDSFQAMVGESRPLFDLRGVFTVQIAELRLSRFVYLFPFALVGMLMASRGEDRFSARLVLAFWGAALFAMTLLQKRFFNSFSVPMVLIFGWSVIWLHARIIERWRADRTGRLVASLGVASLSFWILLPTFDAYHAPAQSLLAGLTGRPIPRDARLLQSFSRLQVAEWIRHNTPPTSGLYDASVRPEYGVLARWGEGHFFKYVAERPTVVGNFGDDLGREHFLLARSFYTSAPQRAAEVLEALGVRYLVIRSRMEKRPMALRLLRKEGEGLGRYRLLYEVGSADGGPEPAYKVFEFVPGAELVGRAPPGSHVEIELGVTSNLAREFVYRDIVESSDDGEYRVRLPYSNRGHPEATRPKSVYRVRVAAMSREVVVEESQVLDGSEIAGPDF